MQDKVRILQVNVASSSVIAYNSTVNAETIRIRVKNVRIGIDSSISSDYITMSLILKGLNEN